MVDVRWVVAVASLVVAGCWSAGQVRYRNHPELASVKLATGEKQPATPDQLGVVRTRIASHDDCDALVTQALSEPLGGVTGPRRNGRAGGEVPPALALERSRDDVSSSSVAAVPARGRGAGGSRLDSSARTLRRRPPRPPGPLARSPA
jgi:hypothetical protein